MESVWWVFRQLWDKDLVYKGFKVMPYSLACSTPLSNFEAGLNYKERSDPYILVSFPLVDDPKVLIFVSKKNLMNFERSKENLPICSIIFIQTQ